MSIFQKFRLYHSLLDTSLLTVQTVDLENCVAPSLRHHLLFRNLEDRLFIASINLSGRKKIFLFINLSLQICSTKHCTVLRAIFQRFQRFQLIILISFSSCKEDEQRYDLDAVGFFEFRFYVVVRKPVNVCWMTAFAETWLISTHFDTTWEIGEEKMRPRTHSNFFLSFLLMALEKWDTRERLSADGRQATKGHEGRRRRKKRKANCCAGKRGGLQRPFRP